MPYQVDMYISSLKFELSDRADLSGLRVESNHVGMNKYIASSKWVKSITKVYFTYTEDGSSVRDHIRAWNHCRVSLEFDSEMYGILFG